MKIITDLRQLGKKNKRPVITIGIFDGVHRGHKKILRVVLDKARELHAAGMVITFNPHPERILDAIGAPPLLVSLKHRLNLIAAEGLDAACVLNFNETFARYDAAEFIKSFLVKKIGAQAIAIGSNFRFGRGKKGGIGLLRSMGKKYGFSVYGVPLLKIDSKTVSSTRIRKLLTDGKLARAKRLLGRSVSVLGTVIKGNGRGRFLGFPTANINPHHEAIPTSGVYAVCAIVGSRIYKGVLNIGQRPTFVKTPGAAFRTAEPSIEVHIFNFDKDIYGRDIEIIFIKRLREERKFASAEKLRKQITIDARNANMVLYKPYRRLKGGIDGAYKAEKD